MLIPLLFILVLILVFGGLVIVVDDTSSPLSSGLVDYRWGLIAMATGVVLALGLIGAAVLSVVST